MALCPGCLTDVFAAQVDGLFQIRQSLVGFAQVAVDGCDTVLTPGIARVGGDDVLEIRQGFIVLAVYFIGQGQVVERSDVFRGYFQRFFNELDALGDVVFVTRTVAAHGQGDAFIAQGLVIMGVHRKGFVEVADGPGIIAGLVFFQPCVAVGLLIGLDSRCRRSLYFLCRRCRLRR